MKFCETGTPHYEPKEKKAHMRGEELKIETSSRCGTVYGPSGKSNELIRYMTYPPLALQTYRSFSSFGPEHENICVALMSGIVQLYAWK